MDRTGILSSSPSGCESRTGRCVRPPFPGGAAAAAAEGEVLLPGVAPGGALKVAKCSEKVGRTICFY